MALTNITMVHQTSILHIYREQPRSTRIVVAYPRPAFPATKRTDYAPTSFDQHVQVFQGHTSYKNKEIEIPRSMVVEAFSRSSRRASQHPAVQKPWASLKKPHESCPFAAPCSPRRKRNDRGQTSAFPSKTSRFTSKFLAHRGSALPWLVDYRGALHLRRIWFVPTR